MRVFLTGGTGYIGEAVVRVLRERGHEVTALNRSPEKDAALRDRGARPVRGDLLEPDGWRDEAAAHEALAHLAFDYSAPPDADRAAIDALLEAAADGGARSLLYTSGCWVLGDTGGKVVDESVSPDHPADIVAWRVGHEERVLAAGGEGLSTAVVRPGIVYGGGGGEPGKMFRTAVEEGAAAYVGDGGNHWSLVHRDDVARLYRLIVEEEASGVFHAVDGHPLPVGEVARAASRAAGAGGAVRGIPVDAAREKLGGVADALVMDQKLSARRSARLGWMPDHASFPDAAGVAYGEWTAARD